MGPEPTGRKRDLRFDFMIEDANTNVQRIYVRHPGAQEYLFMNSASHAPTETLPVPCSHV